MGFVRSSELPLVDFGVHCRSERSSRLLDDGHGRMTTSTDKSLARTVGLDPMAALAVVVVDTMLFGAETVTVGAGWLVTGPIGLLVGVVCLLLQRLRYGDHWGVAAAKGILVGVLTAIPTPLPSGFVLLSGIAGKLGARAHQLPKNEP